MIKDDQSAGYLLLTVARSPAESCRLLELSVLPVSSSTQKKIEIRYMPLQAGKPFVLGASLKPKEIPIKIYRYWFRQLVMSMPMPFTLDMVT